LPRAPCEQCRRCRPRPRGSSRPELPPKTISADLD
jgi:hypothetical protein